jgi:hypothetical protein
MKPAENNIERLLETMDVTPDPQKDRQILNAVLRAQAQTNQRTMADMRPNIWKSIMKNKTIPISIAAAVFMAILFSFNPFEKQVPLTPIAFAEVIKAMEEASWLKMTSKGFQGEVSGIAEQWIGMRDKIHAARWADGKVSFWSVPEGKRYEYLPEENIIQVSSCPDTLPFDVSSPAAMLQGMHDMLVQQGAKMITKESEYDGRMVQLQEISIDVQGQTQSAEFYIEPKSKRLIAAHIWGKSPEGNVNMEGNATFSYHETGPASIYDLGVPREIPVNVLGERVSNPDPIISRIDAAESWPEPAELVQLYWKARHEKNYELTRLYWPHSETWDERTFQEEKSVEYLFGNPEKGGDELTLFVPYDTKEHFEGTRQYRWKMVLTNKQSQKGRYYIISGN